MNNTKNTRALAGQSSIRLGLLFILTFGMGSITSANADGIELEIGTGKITSDVPAYNNTRSLHLGLYRQQASGLVYGLGLNSSDRNEYDFRQQSLTALVGARRTVRGPWYIQSLIGLGISDNDSGIDRSRKPLAAALLRTGARLGEATVALELGLVHTEVELNVTMPGSNQLNNTGVNNLVYNPFAGLSNTPRTRNLTSAALNIGWGF